MHQRVHARGINCIYITLVIVMGVLTNILTSDLLIIVYPAIIVLSIVTCTIPPLPS